MLLRSVGAKELRDTLRGLVLWSLGLAGLVALTVSAYPSVRDNPSVNELVESYPDALKGFFGFGGELDFTSETGYLGAELFSFLIPLLLLVAAIAAGSRALAGEEERGTLDLLLSAPLTRRRVVLEKLAALAVQLALLGAVLVAALLVSARAAGMDIGAGRLAAATGSAVLLALAFGALALLVGALTGSRGTTAGLVAALAVAAYLVRSLAPLLSWLDRVDELSPFYWYSAGEPLRQGLDTGHALLLLALAALGGALAAAAFERRDVGV